jgi:hypothetical protein
MNICRQDGKIILKASAALSRKSGRSGTSSRKFLAFHLNAKNGTAGAGFGWLDAMPDSPILGEPFDWGGKLFAFTQMSASSDGSTILEAYRMVEASKFAGGDASEKLGWRHGTPVDWANQRFILSGPVSIFEADPVPPRRQQRPQKLPVPVR